MSEAPKIPRIIRERLQTATAVNATEHPEANLLSAFSLESVGNDDFVRDSDGGANWACDLGVEEGIRLPTFHKYEYSRRGQ